MKNCYILTIESFTSSMGPQFEINNKVNTNLNSAIKLYNKIVKEEYEYWKENFEDDEFEFEEKDYNDSGNIIKEYFIQSFDSQYVLIRLIKKELV